MEEVLKIAESEGIDVIDVIINAISKKESFQEHKDKVRFS
ncbi:hypothetical protein SACC_26800 [Saccharolobus caldissimus]|uniref:Uncharacterized protein n=1 Tax=Saccharolobus caldissimus TaxID=1702097 RepID=A0AAQ4CV32_9CREN|nr:hypothetical protein SACC_26800 [Saccharolobus caldissimus]